MDSSDFSPEEQQKAAEFVVSKLKLSETPIPEGTSTWGIHPVEAKARELLTDANAALEAVSNDKNIQWQLRRNTIYIVIRKTPNARGGWHIVKFDGIKDAPAAITLCLALAMGWRNE